MTPQGHGVDAGRVVVLDVPGLQRTHVDRMANLAEILHGDAVTDLRPPFPAVTIPVQTTLGSGRGPEHHGDVANGTYDRAADEVTLWGRERAGRDRIWETASEDAGLTTAVLFVQHLVGSSADVAVTPSPIEDENDDLIEMDCWTNPDGFYDDLREKFGHFPLHEYWGPAAGSGSTEWILDAARVTVRRHDPDLLWVYVPHLDYAGLGAGPDSGEFASAIDVVDELLGEFCSTLADGDRWAETLVTVVGEYGFHAVDTPAFPNRALREAGLLSAVPDGNGRDVDLDASSAFALVDHQVAHVYADDDAIGDTREALSSLPGVDAILDEAGKKSYDVDHPNAGDLVLAAGPDAWFQYYWWDGVGDAPAYATDVDIHAKPGFDPCELFFGDEGMVSLDPTRVGGSHGRVDDATLPLFAFGGPAVEGTSLPLDGTVDARAVAPTLADVLGAPSVIGTDSPVRSLLTR